MKPLGKRIAVSPLNEEKKTKGGLIIPETIQVSELSLGVVKFVGTEDMGAKKGDKVLYKKGAGIEFKYNDEDILILNVGEVVAIGIK